MVLNENNEVVGACMNEDHELFYFIYTRKMRASKCLKASEKSLLSLILLMSNLIVEISLLISKFDEKRKEAGVAQRSEEQKQKGGEIFHAFLLGVRADYLNKGLGFELCQKTAQLARERGFKECLAEATSPGTAWICQNYLGAELELTLSFEQEINIVYSNFLNLKLLNNKIKYLAKYQIDFVDNLSKTYSSINQRDKNIHKIALK